MRYGFTILILFALTPLYANKTVNVYAWAGEIPRDVIQAFEKETGITVNFSTYDSNETMYAKLKSSNNIYDVILPSGYFVERMKNQGMLTKLDHRSLSNLKNIIPQFSKSGFDPGNQYSVPLIWGVTGIFYNQSWIKKPATRWSHFWNKRWRNQLMLLDDTREVFAIALLSLGLNPNNQNPSHIKAAYEKLLKLVPNIKLFASDSVQAIMIDEDASIGSAWNGDAFKANQENSSIQFNFPSDGFVIWVDCLAIPKNPPHLREAYQFVNYLLKAESAKQIALKEGHAIANQAGKELLPSSIKNNPMIYPSDNILKNGYFQRDVGEKALALYNEYWQRLKLEF